MKILPIDIIHKVFKRKMMGYDPDEVTHFLSRVSEELEAAIVERNKLKEALREKELQLLEHKDRERVLKDTITTASQMSERIKSDAQREANLIINDANQKADMIVRDARDSLKNTYREINELKKIRLQFESQMLALIDAHKNIITRQDLYSSKAAETDILERKNIHNMNIK